MTLTILIIVLSVGVGFLIVLIIKNVILPKKAAAAKNITNRNTLLKAIRTAKTALDKDPQDVEAHFLLGKAYLADKREEQAFKEYRSANRLGIAEKNIPEIEFRETLAMLYAQFHEEEESLKEYLLLIKKRPEYTEYYFQAGKLFSGRGRPDLAEQYLRKAVSMNPREIRYRSELGMYYYLAKRIKEAGAEFEASLKLDPTNGHALLYMGKILKDAKDYTGAIPYLEKAARDQENKFRALVELGSCYMSLKMLDKAIPELERAIGIIGKEDDTEGGLYGRYFLAMCYEKTGEYEKAIAQWDKIYTQKKNFKDVGEKLTQYIEYRTGTTEKESQKKP